MFAKTFKVSKTFKVYEVTSLFIEWRKDELEKTRQMPIQSPKETDKEKK